MYKALFFLALAGLAFQSCQKNLSDAQSVVDASIEAAGGEKYLKSTIDFDFRDRHYRARREGGIFSYERIFTEGDSITTHDFVTNDGFEREINGKLTEVADSMRTKYTASVNSVIYFALLPYALNDPSVIKKWIGETTIDNKTYYKIEVGFKAEGGGEDHEDKFIYWFDKNDLSIGFMAYSYAESDGIGLRFRKSYNPRNVNGILFVDYVNYKPKGNAELAELEELYKKGELEELSKIELVNIEVN
jgi:hypothetical protein